MQIGVAFPQTEIRANPLYLRIVVPAVIGYGYNENWLNICLL
jgi:hypothetical protein